MVGQEELIDQPVSLRELLIKATLSPLVAIDRQYSKIDLGVFGKEAEDMLQRSLADSQKRERGKMVLITQGGGVKMQKNDDIGNASDTGKQVGGEVNIKIFPNREKLPRAQKQVQFLGMVIHTHPEDQAVTARDISDLLRTENSIQIAPAVLIISPAQKTLYVRSEKTPQLADTEVDKIIEQYRKIFFSPSVKSMIGGLINANLQEAKDQLVAFKLTSELCNKYNINRYSCSTNKNTVVPYSA